MSDENTVDHEAFICRVTQEEVKDLYDKICDYMRNVFGMDCDVSDANCRLAYATLVQYSNTTNELIRLNGNKCSSREEVKILMTSVMKKFEVLAHDPVALREFQKKVSVYANATLKTKLENLAAAQRAERDRVASMQKAERERLVKAALERKKKDEEQAAMTRQQEKHLCMEREAKHAAEVERRKEREKMDKLDRAAAAEERRRVKEAVALAAKRAMEEVRQAKKMAKGGGRATG
jgi:hypothetical protein